jgi:serine/threonine protein kinase
MLLVAGASLDKYEIIAPLAVGGMAELYVVRSRGIASFEKLCVLKRILPQHARDPEFIEMFLDEARLAATLQHPNVVQVYDIGVIDGLYYFTMEYVHGQDLAAIVAAARSQGRGLKLEHSIAIVAAVAAGLHCAHDQRGADGTPLGIVHRDVSPTNILVSYDGNIKVVDFGIAKAAARATHTTAGGAKGKLSYMSPEQVRADRRLDRRSDVFSLGIVLYELTTGRPLFRGASDYLTAELILSGEITPPREIRATYPEALEAIVMRALAKSPDDRFATAREMQLALEELARAEQLRLSSVGLSEYMSLVFPDQVTAWAAARKEGRSLIEYVTAMLATRMASSRATQREPSFVRRWTPAIALIGLGLAAAGWIVAFQRGSSHDEPRELRPAAQPESKPADPTASTTAPSPVPTSTAAVRSNATGSNAPPQSSTASQAPSAKATKPQVASPSRVSTPRGGMRVAKPPVLAKPEPAPVPVPAPVDAGVHPGLDDRLNPFKPPAAKP